MAGVFTLTITSNAGTASSFGETKASERAELCEVLQQAIQAIGSAFRPRRSLTAIVTLSARTPMVPA
jgi:hypothetical protein